MEEEVVMFGSFIFFRSFLSNPMSLAKAYTVITFWLVFVQNSLDAGIQDRRTSISIELKVEQPLRR